MVKVELELPENAWRALCFVAEKFEETPDEWACQYILRELEADAADHFNIYHGEYFAPLSRAVKRLLEGSAEDPCETSTRLQGLGASGCAT